MEGFKVIGQYEIQGEKLGSGAFGDIYGAVNKKGKKFALKIEKTSNKNPQLIY